MFNHLLTAKLSKTREYVGSPDNAPMWVRSMVASWPRRLLMWPITLYLVVSIGIALSTMFVGWIYIPCFLPSYGLLMVLATKTQQAWYRDVFNDYERKHPVTHETKEKPTKTKNNTRDSRGRFKKDA